MKPPNSSRPDGRKPGGSQRSGGGSDRPRDFGKPTDAPGRGAGGGKPGGNRAAFAARTAQSGKGGERSGAPYQPRPEKSGERPPSRFQPRPPPREAGGERPAAAPARTGQATLTARPVPAERIQERPHGRRDFGGSGPRPTADTPRGSVWLYGTHAVAAALANPARRLRRLMLTEEAEAAVAAVLRQPWAIAAERTERPRLDQLLGRDAVHQGAALLADPLAPPSLAQALERPGPILVLDQVSDPRNVGAILRCGAAFGIAAVITQDRNAPDETGALAKAASGALETVPLLRAVNIARTLIALKAAGCWVVGLASDGASLSGPALAERRVALVLGSEGEGMRRLTRETCDDVAGIAMAGRDTLLDSLNVSAAAAVALYELARRP